MLHLATAPAHREWHPHWKTKAQKLMKSREVTLAETAKIRLFCAREDRGPDWRVMPSLDFTLQLSDGTEADDGDRVHAQGDRAVHRECAQRERRPFRGAGGPER